MVAGTILHCPQCRAIFSVEYERCPQDGAVLAASPAEPLVGERFADRYLIEEFVDQGASARVYRAKHHRVSRRFAVKVLLGEHAADDQMRTRFFREAEVACGLEHENLVSVVDVGETDEGVPFLVMDWVEGETLLDVILREAPMPRPQVISFLRQLCRGLLHAHGRGLVHRDFKPENVLVTRNGVCRIVDFGLALPAAADQGRLTSLGMAVGTPAYMAPEQTLGDDVDSRCDLYSLGVILYEMLSGVSPFPGDGVEVARLHMNAPVPRIAAQVPELAVDPDLEELARRLMAKRPDDRFPDTAALLAFVEALDESGPVGFHDTAPMPQTESEVERARVLSTWIPSFESRRMPSVLAIVAVAIAMMGALAVIVLGLSGRLGGEPPAFRGSTQRAAEQPMVPSPDEAEAETEAEVAASEMPAVVGPAALIAASPVPDVEAAAAAQPKARRHSSRSRSRSPVPPVAAADAAPAEVTTPCTGGDFVARYRAIGQRLRDLDTHASASQWFDQYLAIPYQDALRKPAIRAEALARLDRLAAELPGDALRTTAPCRG